MLHSNNGVVNKQTLLLAILIKKLATVNRKIGEKMMSIVNGMYHGNNCVYWRYRDARTHARAATKII